MEQKNKLMRLLRISLVALKRTLIILRTVSFFSMLLMLALLAFFLLSFVRSIISSMYSASLCSLSGAIGRSHVFLFSNAILVILVECSNPSPCSEVDECNRDLDGDDDNGIIVVNKVECGDRSIKFLPPSSERRVDYDLGEQKAVDVPRSKEEGMCATVTKTLEYSETMLLVTRYEKVIDADEEDAWEEDESCLLSTEELNRRCEEFIRKMKEGIQSELRSRNLASYA
ncbi:hypothetical protein Droror1_Dr00002963 [Drosera rotundifolia]